MLRIGLTGGIGSGKSTVARIFETLGIPVYYADEAAKRLMNENASIKKALLEKLGPSSFIDGFLNRKFVAAQVFSNPALLNWLNQLTHPATIADSQHWMQNQSAAYAIREAALLFESGAENGLDYVIGVTAPLSLRIQRVIKRDGTNEAEVQKRMAHQMDEKAKIDRCDFVITNDEEKSILSQVLEIDQKLRELSTRQEPAQSSSNLQ